MEDGLPLSELDKVIDLFRTGELSLGGRMILYKRWSNSKWESPYTPRFDCETTWSSYGSRPEFFEYTLKGSESGLHYMARDEELRKLEAQLSSSTGTPFDSLKDLAADFLGPLWLENVWNNSSAEILAPVRVRFTAACELQQKRAVFAYEVMDGFKPSSVSVRYATYLGQRALSRGTAHETSPERGNSGRRSFKGLIALPRSAERVVFFLSYRGEHVDRVTLHKGGVSGKNPRMTTYELADPGFAEFNTGLAARERKSRGLFAPSVLLLFHFLGFSCMTPSSTDAVDIVAFTNNPDQLIVIECTTDAPDLRGKLGKLASRRRLYGRAASARQPMAVLTTSLPREDISALDMETAHRQGIAVLALENLRVLLSMANQGMTPGNVFTYLREVGPSLSIV